MLVSTFMTSKTIMESQLNFGMTFILWLILSATEILKIWLMSYLSSVPIDAKFWRLICFLIFLKLHNYWNASKLRSSSACYTTFIIFITLKGVSYYHQESHLCHPRLQYTTVMFHKYSVNIHEFSYVCVYLT